jgi:hypothetical protein
MSYEKFRAMRPPLFTKAEEPLEADAFTSHCLAEKNIRQVSLLSN